MLNSAPQRCQAFNKFKTFCDSATCFKQPTVGIDPGEFKTVAERTISRRA
jgi:hypothetical protein